MSFAEFWQHFAADIWPQLVQALGETLYMTIPSVILAYLVGLPLGVLLVITRKGGVKPMPVFNMVLGAVINFLRPIPFLILLALLAPATRALVGIAFGEPKAVIFPLFISAFPYVARMTEGSFNEVDGGVVEAAQSMGSTTMQIIAKVLIPEAMPSLVNGVAICTVTILGYTTMASAVGGGGLGSLAIIYGLNLRRYDVMYSASILLVILVQIITVLGTFLTRKVDHRIR